MNIDRAAIEKAILAAGGPGPPDWAHRQASVSLLFFDKPPTHFLAILKADRNGYVWRNQVALPGGRIDEKDPSSLHAAMRELREELDIAADNVDYLGSLGHFQTLQDTVIEVFVGIWNQRDTIHFDTREIARVIQVPLESVIRTHFEKRLNGRLPGMEELLYPVDDLVIWGVTAKILHHFIERLCTENESSLLSGTA
ncbi:MAG: CoA pyrophosphatase [Thermodesulfobacteriota bacterium]